jgi:O-antigen/teichoic acid export membrane protein
MNLLRQFSKDTLLYGLGKGVKKFIGLLLLPMYTRALSPAEFGIVDSLGALLFFISVFFTLGLDSSTSYFYFKEQNENSRGQILYTAFVLRLLAIIPATALSFFAHPISKLMFGTEQYAGAVLITFLLIPANIIMSEQELVYRFNRKAWNYNVITISKSLCNIVGGIILVVQLKWSVLGAQLASLFSTIAIVLFSFVTYTRFRYTFKFNRGIAKKLIRYGFPLIWASLGVWVYSVSDRFFLIHYKSLDDIGFYSIGSTFSQPIGLINMAVQMSFGVLFYEVYHGETGELKTKSKQLMKQILYLYISVATVLALALCIFSYEILEVVATTRYVKGIVVIPILTCSLIFAQIIEIVPAGISLSEKTWHFTWIIFVAAIVNAGLNFIFIPALGYMGAAITTLIANLVYFVLVDKISSRYFDAEFSRLKIFIYMAIFLLFSLAFPLSEIYWDYTFNPALKFLLLLLFFPMPFIFGFINKSSVYTFLSKLKR